MEKVGLTCAKSNKQLKHLSIIDAIESLRESVQSVRFLYEEIVGCVDEKPKKMPDPDVEAVPSLASVLDTTPELILMYSEEIKRLVADLRSNLF